MGFACGGTGELTKRHAPGSCLGDRPCGDVAGMRSAVREMFLKMLRDFSDKRFEAIADLYAFPAAIYLEDQTLVITSREDLLEAVSSYRATLDEFGIRQAKARDVVVPHTTRRRFIVQSNNTYVDETGKAITHATIHFFVEVGTGGPKIRLVEYKDRPLQDAFTDAELFDIVTPRQMMKVKDLY